MYSKAQALRKAKSSPCFRGYFAHGCTSLRIPLPFVAPSEASGSEEHLAKPIANHNKILNHYPLFAPAIPNMLGVYSALPENAVMWAIKLFMISWCVCAIIRFNIYPRFWYTAQGADPALHQATIKQYANYMLTLEMLSPKGISWNLCLLGTKHSSFSHKYRDLCLDSVRIWWDAEYCTHLGAGWGGRCMWPQYICQGDRVWDTALEGLLTQVLEAWPGRVSSAAE